MNQSLKNEIKKANILWAKSIDEKLDIRYKKIIETRKIL